MQQQLLEKVIDITPETMQSSMEYILTSLSVQPLDESNMKDIVKSLFYGLWNFDKMINQHTLSTKISDLLLKLPKKTTVSFFEETIKYLGSKWNLIDHHRINKFMQFSKYLLQKVFKFCEKNKVSIRKVDKILLNHVFNSEDVSGFAEHLTDVYVDCLQSSLNKFNPIKDLQIFDTILCQGTNETMLLHVIEQIFEKVKERIYTEENSEQTIKELCKKYIELAQKEERDINRRCLYLIVGFFKSDSQYFQEYFTNKQQKAASQKQKRRKKMTKSKKKQVKKLKEKRIQKNNRKKKSKLLSNGKFETQARNEAMKG